ncbi:hypothetical protein INE92_04452 [Bacteroides xylanisolvens]|nr:hypothetical protein INE92_04452 [Bacteroides xylanisolvens]
MKKIIFLCFCALLASCSSDEELQDISTNNEELANMINDYELVLKGYSLDELNLKSATKPLNVLIAFTRPLITEFADNLNLKHPLLPTISPYPTM